MTDYATHCAWCHAELDGAYLTFLPAYDFQLNDPEEMSNPSEAAMRYCSAVCVTKRRGELFDRQKAWRGSVADALQGRPARPEKWDRWVTEVPPELSVMLEMAARRASVGKRPFDKKINRAQVVRVALHEFLDRYLPVPEPTISGSADDVAGELHERRAQ